MIKETKYKPISTKLSIYSKIKGSLDFNSVLTAHLIIASIFTFLAGFFIITGYAPVHDAISWHGIFHYFYNSVEKAFCRIGILTAKPERHFMYIIRLLVYWSPLIFYLFLFKK